LPGVLVSRAGYYRIKLSIDGSQTNDSRQARPPASTLGDGCRTCLVSLGRESSVRSDAGLPPSSWHSFLPGTFRVDNQARRVVAVGPTTPAFWVPRQTALEVSSHVLGDACWRSINLNNSHISLQFDGQRVSVHCHCVLPEAREN
jgi:hypothetical protein